MRATKWDAPGNRHQGIRHARIGPAYVDGADIAPLISRPPWPTQKPAELSRLPAHTTLASFSRAKSTQATPPDGELAKTPTNTRGCAENARL